MLRILYVSANPEDTTRLRLDRENREIQEAVRGSKKKLELHVLPAARLQDLSRALHDFCPDILFFSGHGVPEGLVLEDDKGRSRIISSEEIVGNFRTMERPLQAIVLMAIHSAGLAARFSADVAVAVGLRGSITDRAATEFRRAFMRALGAGETIARAIESGRTSTLSLGLPGIDPIVVFNRPESEPSPSDAPAREPRIFLSYAQKDRSYVKRFMDHLSALKHAYQLSILTTDDIPSGSDRTGELRKFAATDIFVPLVSGDYLRSAWCQQELSAALLQSEQAGIRIAPVVVRPCDWSSTPLYQVKVIPGTGRAVSEYEDQDRAWKEVVQQINTLLRELVRDRPASPEHPGSGQGPAGSASRRVSPRTTRIEVTLQGEMEHFDQQRFLQALADVAEVPVSALRISDIKRGSTILTLSGDDDALDRVLARLKPANDAARAYMASAGVTRLRYELDGVWVELAAECLPPAPAQTAEATSRGRTDAPATPKKAVRPTMPKRPPVRVLVLAANPQEVNRTALNQEVEDIQESLERAHRRRLRIKACWVSSWRALRRAVQAQKPHVLHVSGRGTRRGGLMLTRDDGKRHDVPWEALADLCQLVRDDLVCLLFNACYASALHTMLEEHVDYIVGSSGALDPEVAREFAVGFYDALGRDEGYEQAFASGRVAARGTDPAVAKYFLIGGRKVPKKHVEE